jgi:NTE family protein
MYKEPLTISQKPLAKSNFVAITSSFFAYCLLLIALLLFTHSSYSQEKTNRPKIGLVLSGGGAKGFAHIGVLKALEKGDLKRK